MLTQQHQLTRQKKTPRKRLAPLILIGMGTPVLIALIAGLAFLQPQVPSRAAGTAVNGKCTLLVPKNPLSAQGLASSYQLIATNPANGPCHEANKGQAAFVEGAIIDPASGQISIYDPLVIDHGTQPAIAPVVPQLPAHAIVGLWFGSNGTTLTLQDSNGSLNEGNCVNGLKDSNFGQFAYCNAEAFFTAANKAIQSGKIKPPPLGKGRDNQLCMSVRDFGLVDQDQSDNVVTTYLVTASGTTAQMTEKNVRDLRGAHTQSNGSDNRLLDIAVDQDLGCSPWTAPDLADKGKYLPALPLNELQAAYHQAAPVALVPLGDPMTLNNGQQDLGKVNAYREGVDQQRANHSYEASTKAYCANLLTVGATRLEIDKQLTKKQQSPDASSANSLFTFLARRFVRTYGEKGVGLHCTSLINKADPVKITIDRHGVVVDASISPST